MKILPNINKADFGQMIKRERENMCFSLNNLAQKLKINPTTLLKWEKGQTFPSYKHLKNVMDLLGFDIVKVRKGELTVAEKVSPLSDIEGFEENEEILKKDIAKGHKKGYTSQMKLFKYLQEEGWELTKDEFKRIIKYIKPTAKKKTKPTAKKKRIKKKIDEEKLFRDLISIHKEYVFQHPELAGISDIPYVYNELKNRGWDIKLEDFHKLLLKYWDERRIILSITESINHVEYPQMGIKSRHGRLYFIKTP